MKAAVIEAANLTLTARLPDGTKKNILERINLRLCGFVGLLGASGGGKSSLLKVLSCRFAPSKRLELLGEVRVNGKPVEPREMTRIAKVVPQFDQLLHTLTVRELLQYQSQLCMSADSDARDKEVERVAAALSLHRCLDTRASNLSGGEQRRVSVGLELLTSPKILFLDEPTSGLDSHVAFLVLETLQRLASTEHCTVICSIHQPSARMVQLFTDLVVLDAGQLVYQGAVARLPVFLEDAGLPCPPLSNPVEHLLDALDSYKVSPEEEEDSEDASETATSDLESAAEELALEDGRPRTEDASNLVARFAQWSAAQGSAKSAALRSPSSTAEVLQAFELDDGFERPVSNASLLWTLLRRNTRSLLRNRQVLRSKLVAYLFLAFILATTFLKIPDTQAGASRILSLMFMVVTQNSFSTAVSALGELPVDRVIFSREYANGLYPVRIWWAARCLVTYVYQALFCQAFAVIVYFACGLFRTPQAFFVFDAALVCIAFCAVSIAFVIGAALKNPSSALQFLPVVMLIPLIFSGFLILPVDIPVWYVWLLYLSFIRYGYSILILNQFDTGFEFASCDPDTDYCPYGAGVVSGSEVVSSGGYDTIDMWANFLVLVALWAVLVLAGGFALKRTAKRELQG